MANMKALRHRPGLLGGAIRVISSIWLGIALLVVIILYSSIGSAVPPFRQYFELTEFAYFNHWIFAALCGAFCVVLTAATVVRIPFNRVNLGVITTHTGLLMLVAGSVLYFGRKIEGDVLLFNPRVEVLSAQRLHSGGGANPVVGQVVAAEGQSWEAAMPGMGGNYRVEVASVEHNGLQTAAAVSLKVRRPGVAEPETIELRQDAPGKAFARMGEHFFLQLRGTNVTDRFFDNNTPALLVRRGGSPVLFSLEGLPLYHERVVPGHGEIRDTENRIVTGERLGRFVGIDQWTLPLRIGEPDRVDLSDWPFTMEIDAYLPYAVLQRSARPGGEAVNPVARFEVVSGPGARSIELFANVPRDARFSIPGMAAVEFQWLEAGRSLPEEWTRSVSGRHVLDVHVKDRDVRRSYDVQPGQTIAVEGTDYQLTIEDVQSDWPLVSPGVEGARSPIVRVLVSSPIGKMHRTVLQRFPNLSQDRDDLGRKMSDKGLADENIEIRYTDASSPSVVVAAAPDMAPVAICTEVGGKRRVEKVEIGRPIEMSSSTRVTLRELIERPRFEHEPTVIPVEQRRPQAGRQASLVRLHLKARQGDWERRVWLPFSYYNDMIVDEPIPWITVSVPDVGAVDFLYGRTPRPLPGRLALENMHVDFYPGRNRPAGWTSFIRWEDPATGQVRRDKAYLNNTAKIGPWTLFQSGEARDHQTYTILGVGNRDGVMTMLMGCVLATLGMAYAFYVKPILKRRLADRLARQVEQTDERRGSPRALSPVGAAVVALALALGSATAVRADEAASPAKAASDPAASLREIQGRIDLDRLRTLMVQHDSRYQTLEAWARDMVATIHGKERMLGLDPVAAVFELMFNRDLYDDLPVIYVKDMAVRKHITSHPVQVSPEEAKRILKTGLISSNYLSNPAVARIVDDLSSKMTLRRAMDRFVAASAAYGMVFSRFNVVPSPAGDFESAWHTLDRLLGNLSAGSAHAGMSDQAPIPGITPETAAGLLNDFRSMARAWAERDPAGINKAIIGLAETLPTLAPAGTYPSLEQRKMEVVYHNLQALTFGWALYVAALFASIWALLAGHRWTRMLAMGLFLLAFAAHGAGVGMRWYIIGRVPVANMFEAVVTSAFLGAALALVLELSLKRGVFVLAGSFLGFLSLVLGRFVGAQITQIAPILDDIMLRIHTVLIIASYAVITLAFVVATCYLVVSARGPRPQVARVTLGMVASLGLCAALATQDAFHRLTDISNAFIVIIPTLFALAGALLFLVLPWNLGRPAMAVAIAPPGAAGIVSSAMAATAVTPRENSALLDAFDRSHMILLHMATISLFVGLVLGAVWADYSWGRPWGWDPKEVFALVTWLFYAILIHARFAAKRRALWTAVLSCIGFAAMQFNWWVVNFYIVGLHSYA